MVAPVIALALASAGAKGLGSLLQGNAAKKAEKAKQRMANDFTTQVQAPAFDFRLLTQQQGNQALAANQRENLGAQDRIIRQAQADDASFLDKRTNNQINTSLAAALASAETARANQGADERASLAQTANATTARQGKVAAFRKAQDAQYGIQNEADAIAQSFMATLGAGQEAADRGAASARRDKTLAQALTAPTLYNGTPIGDDVVQAEFARQNQQGADRARTQATALNQVKAYGDAALDAGIRQTRFGQDLGVLGIKSDYAKAALPYHFDAIDARQGADDASAGASRDILTAFQTAMGAAKTNEIGAVGQATENNLADNQQATARTNDAILGTSNQKYATLADALRANTNGVVDASAARESTLANLLDTRIRGTYGNNKLGNFLSTAGDIGMTVASIMAGMPGKTLGSAPTMDYMTAMPVRGASLPPTAAAPPRIAFRG